MSDDLEYRPHRPDLERSVRELLEAGYQVTYWSLSPVVMTGPDFPIPEFCVRIARGGDQWDGIAGHEDEAFEEGLAKHRAAGI